jgi:hypothetical protein
LETAVADKSSPVLDNRTEIFRFAVSAQDLAADEATRKMEEAHSTPTVG